VIRPALIIVLLASSTKLLGASNALAGIAVALAAVVMVAVSLIGSRRRSSAAKSLVGVDATAR
jgi:hypothetical protein